MFFVGAMIVIGIALVLLEIFYRPAKPKIYYGMDFAILDQISPVIIIWHDPNAYSPYRIKIYSDVLNLNTGESSIENLAETIEEFVRNCARIIERGY